MMRDDGSAPAAVGRDSERAALPARRKLGEILAAHGAASPAQLDKAAQHAEARRIPIGEALLETRTVSGRQLAVALAEQHRMPFVDLDAEPPSEAMASWLPEATARQCSAVVISKSEERATVAMADPKDMRAGQEIERFFGTRQLRVERAFASPAAIESALDRLYSKGDAISDLARAVTKDLSSSLVAASGAMANDASAVAKYLQSVFDDAVARRATDVHIEPMEAHLGVRMRIDGDLVALPKADKAIAAPVVQRLKLMADLDVGESRKPQDGRMSVKTSHGKVVDARLATMPTKHGESVVVRLIAARGQAPQLDDLGLHAQDLADFKAALDMPNGLILLTGPTGSGKTTTLYSALGRLNDGKTKIITIEDPIESSMEGIVQTEVKEKAGYTFISALRSVLRQDPDVVLIGEMRDGVTAATGLQAAQTGHLVLSTLHTNDAKSAPGRLVAMGAEAFMVASSLRAVVAQRLIKLSCVHCKEAVPIDAASAAWLSHIVGADHGRSQFKGRGCPRCLDTGWHGRRAIHESLTLDEELIDLLQRGATQDFLRTAGQRIKGRSLACRAAQLALEGHTTVEEARRATGGS